MHGPMMDAHPGPCTPMKARSYMPSCMLAGAHAWLDCQCDCKMSESLLAWGTDLECKSNPHGIHASVQPQNEHAQPK